MIEVFEELNGYNKYLREHISNVMLGYKWIKENTSELLEGTTPNLEIEIENHDASKYSDEEFHPYRRHCQENEITRHLQSCKFC